MTALADIFSWLNANIDPRVQQAVIAGLFLAVGWVVNGWQNRRRDERLRLRRISDVQRALFAEIRAYLAALMRDDLEQYGADVAKRIRTDDSYFPVIPQERNRSIFSAIVAEIHILPRAVIDPVALYYSQLVAIEAIIDDLKGIDKSVIGAERAARMYEDYIAMKREALMLGQDALLLMGGYLDGGAERLAEVAEARRLQQTDRTIREAQQTATKLEEKPSSPDADRSDP